MISNFLFVLLTLYIIIYIFSHFIKWPYFIVNFNSLFTVGFIYYLILPYYYMIFTKDNTVRDMFEGVNFYAKDVSEVNKCLFLGAIFLFHVSMMYFSKRHAKSFCNKNNSLIKSNNTVIYQIIFVVVAFICLFFTYKFRNYLGKGYTDTDNMTGGKGSFISASLILFILSFMIKRPNNKIVSLYTVLYMLFAILIVTMGGRLYFLTSLVVLFVFFVNYKYQIKIKHLLIITVIIAIIFSMLGVIRQGNRPTIKLVLFIFLGEPILTSYSLFSCLALNNLPVLNFPYELTIGFLNLIPSFIIPNKVSLINNITMNSGVVYVAPVGAENIFTSLMVNFGLLGIPIFSVFISYFLRIIRKINEHLYFFAISWFVFTFFRDPFYVSFIKILFEFCLFFSIIMIGIVGFVRISLNKECKIEDCL